NLKEGESVIGTRAKVKVVKNKLAPPFQEAEFDILYGSGISRGGEGLDLGVQLGLVGKAGSYFSIRGERVAQGRERAIEGARERPRWVEELAAQELPRNKPIAPAPPPPAEAAA